MLATFWQCCLTNPWQLGWMPQEQWLSGEIKITRNYCEQDFLIFPIWCINIFYHFLPFTIIYCAVYCWWQPFRFRSWSRCSPRRTCLNFLVDFQRERRRRRQRENIQKKKVWTVWTTIYISLYIIYIIIYLYNILENIQTRYVDVWSIMMMGSSLTHIGWKVPAAFDCAVVHTPVCLQIYMPAQSCTCFPPDM